METNSQVYVPVLTEWWWIRLCVKDRAAQVRVQCIYISSQIERYRVVGKDRNIVVQTDRPVYYHKPVYRHLHKWKIVEGTVPPSLAEEVVQQIAIAIERYYRERMAKLYPYDNPKIDTPAPRPYVPPPLTGWIN